MSNPVPTYTPTPLFLHYGKLAYLNPQGTFEALDYIDLPNTVQSSQLMPRLPSSPPGTGTTDLAAVINYLAVELQLAKDEIRKMVSMASLQLAAQGSIAKMLEKHEKLLGEIAPDLVTFLERPDPKI